MSKVYAPVDAVNHHKRIDTVIPNDVNLTDHEKSELFEVEELFYKNKLDVILRNSSVSPNFRWTTNVGLFYFALENNIALKEIAGNEHLTPLIIFLLTRKMVGNDALLIGSQLMRNKTVINDFALTQIVWEVITSPETLKAEREARTNFILTALNNFLVTIYNSESFFHVLSSCGSTLDAQVDRENVKKFNKTVTTILTLKEAELFSWLREHQPDLSELPLDWVLELWGFGNVNNNSIAGTD